MIGGLRVLTLPLRLLTRFATVSPESRVLPLRRRSEGVDTLKRNQGFGYHPIGKGIRQAPQRRQSSPNGCGQEISDWIQLDQYANLPSDDMEVLKEKGFKRRLFYKIEKINTTERTRDHRVVVLRGGLQRQPIQALCKHWNATMRTGPTLAIATVDQVGYSRTI